MKQLKVRRDFIFQSHTLGNFLWAIFSFLGGSIFFILGICSYFNFNLFLIFQGTDIQFFPQGILLFFYGLAGSLLGIYLYSIFLWRIGDGYNEFNRQKEIIRIFRWGFPGKNRKILFSYSISEVENLIIKIQEGLNSQSTLYLKLKNGILIPLTRTDAFLTIKKFEYYAADLAQFLKVPLKDVTS